MILFIPSLQLGWTDGGERRDGPLYGSEPHWNCGHQRLREVHAAADDLRSAGADGRKRPGQWMRSIQEFWTSACFRNLIIFPNISFELNI